MYKIELINNGVVEVIHHAHTNANKVLSCEISESVNTVSICTISIPATTNTNINLFKSMIRVSDLEKNIDVFLGRVIKSTESMETDGTFSKTIECESMLGILNDTYVREYIKDATPSSALSYYISKAVKYSGYKFKAGIVEDYADTANIEVNYETVLSSILNLAEITSRKIQVRIEGKNIYIDLLKNLSSKKVQTIQMGVNMLSITKELDTSDFANRIIPLASDEEGNKLTIKKVNDNKDFIQDDEMVSEYGVIEMVVEDTGTIKDAKTLLKWAKSQLSYYKAIKLVLDCSAVDLSYLSGYDMDRVEIDDQIQIINNPLGVNVVVRVIEKTWNIYEPFNPQLSLSSRKYTATDQILDIRNRQRIKNKVSVLSTQYVSFEDNITKSKALIKEFSVSGTYIDAYIDLKTYQYRYYTETGESYTTHPKDMNIYINSKLVCSFVDADDISEIVNVADYIQSGLNTLKITTSRNGRVGGTINIKARG